MALLLAFATLQVMSFPCAAVRTYFVSPHEQPTIKHITKVLYVAPVASTVGDCNSPSTACSLETVHQQFPQTNTSNYEVNFMNGTYEVKDNYLLRVRAGMRIVGNGAWITCRKGSQQSGLQWWPMQGLFPPTVITNLSIQGCRRGIHVGAGASLLVIDGVTLIDNAEAMNVQSSSLDYRNDSAVVSLQSCFFHSTDNNIIVTNANNLDLQIIGSTFLMSVEQQPRKSDTTEKSNIQLQYVTSRLRLLIESCKIRGHSAGGIRVTNSKRNSTVRFSLDIRKSTIHGGEDCISVTNMVEPFVHLTYLDCKDYLRGGLRASYMSKMRLNIEGSNFSTNAIRDMACIRENEPKGVRIHKSADTQATMRSTRFEGNHDGVSFERSPRGHLFLQDCKLPNNIQYGLRISSPETMAQCVACVFSRNRVGIAVYRTYVNLTINRSEFFENDVGMYFLLMRQTEWPEHGQPRSREKKKRSVVRIHQVTIAQCAKTGIEVSDGYFEKNSQLNMAADIQISDSVIHNNFQAGIMLKLPSSSLSIHRTEVSHNVGPGITVNTRQTGILSMSDVKLIDNSQGLLVDARAVNIQNAVVIGNSYGISLFSPQCGRGHVDLRNLVVTGNFQGLSCGTNLNHSVCLTGRRISWHIGGYLYLNSLGDVNCHGYHHNRDPEGYFITLVHESNLPVILGCMAFAGDVLLVLPPVLQSRPKYWWKDARVAVRMCIVLSAIIWTFVFLIIILLAFSLKGYAPVEEQQLLMLVISSAVTSLLIAVLGRLVAEVTMRKWTKLKIAYTHSQKELDLIQKQTDLQSQLLNVDLFTDLAQLHYSVQRAALVGNLQEATNSFQQMKPLAEEENRRLSRLTTDRRSLYESEPERMAFLTQIASTEVREPVQVDVPKHIFVDDNDVVMEQRYLDYIHRQAVWILPVFVQTVCSLINEFNKDVIDPQDLVILGLLPKDSIFTLPFLPETHRVKPERRAALIGRNCALFLANVKQKERGRDKIANEYLPEAEAGLKKERPVGRYVCDWLRATVIAEDPYALAVLYEVFKASMPLVRVKNNFAGKGDPVKCTNILGNFEVQSGQTTHVVEIQFMLQDYHTIRFVQHRMYEIIRAHSFDELLSKPVFHGAAAVLLPAGGENVPYAHIYGGMVCKKQQPATWAQRLFSSVQRRSISSIAGSVALGLFSQPLRRFRRRTASQFAGRDEVELTECLSRATMSTFTQSSYSTLSGSHTNSECSHCLPLSSL